MRNKFHNRTISTTITTSKTWIKKLYLQSRIVSTQGTEWSCHSYNQASESTSVSIRDACDPQNHKSASQSTYRCNNHQHDKGPTFGRQETNPG